MTYNFETTADLASHVVEFATSPRIQSNDQFENHQATWPDFISTFGNPYHWGSISQKDAAPVMTACTLATPECNNRTVVEMSMLISDHDSGQTMLESKQLLEQAGHAGLIYPSFRNGTDQVDISHDDFVAWTKSSGAQVEFSENSGRQYLIEKNILIPRLAEESTYRERAQTAKGIVYRFSTPPVDKHRVIRPLLQPINLPDAVVSTITQQQVIDAWGQAYKKVLADEGCIFDPACSDPSRRYFVPVLRKGRDLPATIIVAGNAVDMAPHFRTALDEIVANASKVIGRSGVAKSTKSGAKTSEQDVFFENINIQTWIGQHGRTFDIEQALLRAGLVLGDRPAGGVFCKCHRDDHSGGVQQTFATNNGEDEYFTLHCSGQTGGCCDMDRVQHIIGYLRTGKLKLDELFNESLGGGRVSQRVLANAKETEERRLVRTCVKDDDGRGIDTAVFLQNKASVLNIKKLQEASKKPIQIGADVTAIDLANHIRLGNFTVTDLIDCCAKPSPETELDAALRELARKKIEGSISAVSLTTELKALAQTVKANLGDVKSDFEHQTALIEKEATEFGLLSQIDLIRLSSKHDYPARFAIIDAGHAYVLDLEQPNIVKALKSHEDFIKLHRDDWKLMEGKSGKPYPLYPAEEFLKFPPPETRFYRGGIVFSPPTEKGVNVSPDCYNLFSGFGIKPDASGDCSYFHKLIREVWANGDDELYHWCMEYFMHMIRFPGDKVGTAIAIRGEKGDGKSIVAEKLMAPILGDMLLTVANQNMVLGDYNEALTAKLLTVFEEAAFAGDRGAFAKIKHMITSDTIHINPKHKAPFTIDNFSRVVLISNQNHFVDIEPNDRRYTVLNSSSAWKGSNNFEALLEQWNSGGAQRFVYEAMTRDFRRMESSNRLVIETKVKTATEAGQVSESRTPEQKFFVEFLLRGDFTGAQNSSHIKDWRDTPPASEVWSMTEPLEIPSLAIQDAAAEFFKLRVPNKMGHVPSLKSLIATMDVLYGGTKSGRESLGGGNKGATFRILPPRAEALRYAYENGLITDEDLEASGFSHVATAKKSNLYVVLQLPTAKEPSVEFTEVGTA